MSNKRAIQSKPLRRRRYIYHDALKSGARTYLVYYYSTEKIILMTDGPFIEEVLACNKMKEFLLKGYCAWMVSYNE
tara:strand:+ start:559 stop:786 length:228 start_codon:yes stop_codon:yes gene_type:complete